MSSDTRPSVIEALALVMQDVTHVGKEGFNEQQRYRFRGIDGVMNSVGPALRKVGVVVTPILDTAEHRDVQTSTGKSSRETTVTVTYRFYGPHGDYIDTRVPGESMDFGDKGTPKAMSVAFRTALLQVLCLPTDEPDADQQTYERAPSAPPAGPKRTAQRRTQPRTATPQPEPPAEPAEEPQGPPLPGEDGYENEAAPRITKDQMTKLHTVFSTGGVNDRDTRLQACQLIVGRVDLQSSKDLTKAEASRLIDQLEQWATDGHLAETIAELVDTTGGES
jgi:hypothetical protein